MAFVVIDMWGDDSVILEIDDVPMKIVGMIEQFEIDGEKFTPDMINGEIDTARMKREFNE